MQKDGIKEFGSLVKAKTTHYTFNTVFVEIETREDRRDDPLYYCYKDVGNAVMGKVYDSMTSRLKGAKGDGTKGDALESIMAMGYSLKHSSDPMLRDFLSPVGPIVVYVENQIRDYLRSLNPGEVQAPNFQGPAQTPTSTRGDMSAGSATSAPASSRGAGASHSQMQMEGLPDRQSNMPTMLTMEGAEPGLPDLRSMNTADIARMSQAEAVGINAMANAFIWTQRCS